MQQPPEPMPLPVLCPPIEDDEEEIEGTAVLANKKTADEEDQPPILLKKDKTNPDSATKRSFLSAPLRRHFGVLKKRKLTQEEAQRVAQETSHMVHSEVRRWEQAVAELEAYLQARAAPSPAVQDEHGRVDNNDQEEHFEEEGEDQDAVVQPKAVFPALPKVVMVVPPSDGDDESVPTTSMD